MTVDEAIRKYRYTINTLPDRWLAIRALATLFSGIRAHRDSHTLLDAFERAIPQPSRDKHIKAMEMLIIDLAACEEANRK